MLRTRIVGLSVFAAFIVLAPADAAPQAQSADVDALARAFGMREDIQQMSLSPDGSKVAFLAPHGDRGTNLYVVAIDKGGEPRQITTSNSDRQQISRCEWTSNLRLACNVFVLARGAQDLAFTRQVALNADGSEVKVLSAPDSAGALAVNQQGGIIIDRLAGGDGSVLMTRNNVETTTTGSNVRSARPGLSVDLVDTLTLRRRPVEPPRSTAVEYITDGHGTVRIMGLRPDTNLGMMGPRIDYMFRRPGSRTWERLSSYDIDSDSGFNPYAVSHERNLAYGFDRHEGRLALFSMMLDGSGKRELILARPDVDVDGLIRIGRQRRVVGASYATDRRNTVFFDPELEKLGESLGRALPNQPNVSFLDASMDENRLLLFAGGDTHPGAYYVYDKTTRRLATVLPARDALAETRLATVRAVEYPAADGTRIPAYLTLPSNGETRPGRAIVLPHGGPGARDEWGFDWLAQFLAARGYAVLQPNFRGSSGYGDAWYQRNGFQSWRTAIGDVNDGGRWLIREGVTDANGLAILGWSYGGYAALQSTVLDPDLFKAIVAIAPVTDLETLRGESRGFTSFSRVDAFIGQGPHVRQGSPALHAGRFRAPVLLFHGTLDQNVGVGQSRLMARRLRDAGKAVDYVEFDGLMHSLDDSAARTRMLRDIDAFLARSLTAAN